jgi:transposase
MFFSAIAMPTRGLDPEAYLRHMFSRIADHPVNQASELLP